MRTLGVAALVLLVAGPVLRAAEPDPTLAADEKFLRDHRVSADGPSLLAFFRDRTLTEERKSRLADLIKRLGGDDFEVREKASADLVKAARVALPLLKPGTYVLVLKVKDAAGNTGSGDVVFTVPPPQK